MLARYYPLSRNAVVPRMCVLRDSVVQVWVALLNTSPRLIVQNESLYSIKNASTEDDFGFPAVLSHPPVDGSGQGWARVYGNGAPALAVAVGRVMLSPWFPP